MRFSLGAHYYYQVLLITVHCWCAFIVLFLPVVIAIKVLILCGLIAHYQRCGGHQIIAPALIYSEQQGWLFYEADQEVESVTISRASYLSGYLNFIGVNRYSGIQFFVVAKSQLGEACYRQLSALLRWCH